MQSRYKLLLCISVLYYIHVMYIFSSSNIGEFSRDMQMLAALQEEESDGDRLMEAARKLAGAFSDLLSTVQPGSSRVSFGYGRDIRFVW